jgi:hypothetical protein
MAGRSTLVLNPAANRRAEAVNLASWYEIQILSNAVGSAENTMSDMAGEESLENGGQQVACCGWRPKWKRPSLVGERYPATGTI